MNNQYTFTNYLALAFFLHLAVLVSLRSVNFTSDITRSGETGMDVQMFIIKQEINPIKETTLSESAKKKIEEKKAELQTLKKLYSEPEKIPGEIKVQLTKKIEKKKQEINKLVNEPEQVITAKRLQKWAGIQVVKVFLGIPIIPGK